VISRSSAQQTAQISTPSAGQERLAFRDEHLGHVGTSAKLEMRGLSRPGESGYPAGRPVYHRRVDDIASAHDCRKISMKHPIVSLLAPGIAVLSLILASGCGCRDSRVTSSLGITAGGRDIKARVDAPASISARGEEAVLSFGHRSLVVEKERILIDGKEVARLPAAADRIEVEIADGRLKMTAGDREVFSGPLPP
jgi:hypothetical protein